MANTIEQYGITWTFDKELSLDGEGDTYRYGQFVNGDYWVIGPVNITGITPDSHLTEAGEKDYLNREYAAVIGEATGAWTFYKSGSYWRATIPLSDTSLVPGAGKTVLLSGASGSDAAMVNGRTGTVQVTVLNESVTVSFPIDFQGSTELEVTGGLVGGAIINGSMINPTYNTSTHGYTSETHHYRPELNAAFGISALNPLEVPVGSSLISTISRQYLAGRSPQTGVKTAAVLTVLDSDAFDELPDGVGPGDCFRPSYFGDTKPIRFWKQLLDYSFLAQLEPIGTVPTLEEMEDQFQRPWIRTAESYTSRHIHPSDNMPDYYKQAATNNGALVLNLNYSNAQKETLLVNYTQLGIDLYAPYELGSRGNEPDGGHFSGFLLPMLVAGKALGYAPMRDICAKSGSYRYSAKPGGGNYGDGDLPPDYLYFQELDQTYYVSQLEVDVTTGDHPTKTWTPSGISLTSEIWIPNGGTYSYGDPFGSGDIGLPEYGIRHSTFPERSCKLWGVYNDYRALNSPYYSETAFLMLAMGLKPHVNHDAFFDYGDRWAAVKGQSNMRSTYRADYGPLWTADLSVIAKSVGIRDTEIDLKATISGGVGDYTVQWQQWDGEAFVDIAGATTAIYTVTGLSAGIEYTFRVVVEDEESPATQVTDTVVVSTTGELANTIEQYGITWTFDKELSLDGEGDTYRYGQFVNGDYWVVGPVTITSINPLCQTVDERVVNGTMINPHAGSLSAGYGQGYDSAASQWNAALNVGDDLPLAVAAGSSVVSTISRPAISRTAVKTAAILTVLSQAPAEGSFRPPYSGTDKTIYFNKSDLDYTKLSNLTEQTGAPSLSTAAAWFEKPWIDHVGDWYGAQIHPSDNMSNYGREMARKTSEAALLLNGAYSNAEKETLLVRYVQLGIDNYAVVSQGIKRIYVANGGHGGGRKLPILVAGLVLDDVTLKGVGSKSGAYLYNSVDEDGYPDPYGPGNEPADYMSFGEDDQTHYVTQFDVDLTNGPTWKPDERDDVLIPYTVDDIGLPEWGIRHSSYPRYNNNWWPTNYRSVAGCTFPGTALAAHIMGLKTFWNNDAFFDYCDRYMAMIVVGGAYESWRTGANRPGDFVNNMWAAYRENYGSVWTADLSVFAEWTGKSDTTIDLKATISGGVGDYTVQWQRWDGEAFIDIVGATTAEYTVTGLSAEQEYTFRIVVEDEESPSTEVTDTIIVSTTGTEEPVLYLLTKSPNIMASGATPVTGDYYEAGAVLILTAVEHRYTLFTGWSGDASGTRKQIQITMNSAKNITASFAEAERKSKIVTAGNFILPLTTKHEVAL